jgi:hypothetical protein
MAPRPKALPSFVVLGASSAAKAGGDISVLLPTGLVLFHPNALNLLNEAVGRYCISKAIVHSFFFFLFLFSFISAALFFLYFIANFLVPNFISKSFQLDKESEDRKQSDDDSN